jgi:hypothetical protein
VNGAVEVEFGVSPAGRNLPNSSFSLASWSAGSFIKESLVGAAIGGAIATAALPVVAGK